jgi:Flp pilus assembly protein TadG
MRRFTALLKRFRRDESGAFMVLFAVLALVLIATSGAVVDFTSVQTARSRAQTAIDAATLALQTKVNDVAQGKVTKADAEADVKTKAAKILQERLGDTRITATITSATISVADSRLDIVARITVPTSFVQLVGISTISAQINSRAVRGSTDLEVSVALDVTGSMAPCDKYGNCDYTKINALKDAAKNLITDVVSTTQTPTYSKMALVPYSYGVNVGTYATSVRGALTTLTGKITAADWASSQKSISNINVVRRGSVTVTANSHGLSTGDTVYIAGMSGSSTYTNLNNTVYTVTKVDSNNFTLNSVSGSTSKSGNPGGYVYKCKYTNCNVQLTGSFSSFKNGDGVVITGLTGLTNLNNDGTNNVGFFASSVTATTMQINAKAAGGQYTTGAGSNAKATRANYKDIYYHFNSANGGENTFSQSTCVTERYGDDAYTDTAPSTSLLSPMYPSTAANCVSQQIVPLTSDTTKLTDTVTALSAAGSTSGHIGLAWGWYMLAPKFGYLWPTSPIDSRPAAYKRANLTKALILMTDGQFNTDYYNGVIAQDSTSDSSNNMINQNGPNGSSTSQANALCTAIKDASTGILLYTVGFDIGSTSQVDKDARSFLSGCATNTTYFYQADSADDLKDAFKQIAQRLDALRLAH